MTEELDDKTKNEHGETTPAEIPADKATKETSNKKMYSRDELAKAVAAQMAQYKKEQSMTEEERQKEAIKKFQERENELQRRENEFTIRSELQEAKLPIDIAPILSNADLEKAKNAVQSLKTYLMDAIENEVQERLKGKNNPASGASSTGGITREEIMKEPDINKRQELINKNLDLFK